MLVGGEAGVGKSRLIRELSADATRSGFRVHTGSAVDFGNGGLPFGAVADALRPIARELGPEGARELLGGGVRDLARLLPDLGAADEAAPDIRHDPHATARLFEVVLRLLEALASSGPVLVVLEDLHWADASTRELFAFLSRNAVARFLLVGTYRSDELHRTHPLRPLLAAVRGRDGVRILELSPFPRDVVAAQIRAILGQEPDEAFLGRIHGRSLGNPFFVEELLSSATDRRLPDSLRDALLLRVDAVPPGTRPVLDALAVIGRPATEALISAATAADPGDVAAALREAVDRGIVVRIDDDGRELAFRHALFQEAVYEDLLEGERARIHRAVAAALLGAGPALGRAGNVDAELAVHHRRGNQPAEALAAAARAAASAASRFAFAEALAQWEQVLELWEAVPSAASILGRDHADVLGDAAQAAGSAGAHRRAIGFLRAAVEELDPVRDRLRAAYAHAGLMTELFTEGNRTEAEPSRAAALALLEGEPPSLTHLRVLNLVAYPPLFASRYDEVAESAGRALAMAESLGAESESGLARVPLGMALAFLGRDEQARAHLDRAIEIAHRVAHPQPIADAYAALGIVLEAGGRFDEAVAVLTDGLARLREFGVERTHGGTMATDRAEAKRRLGRWAEALSELEGVMQHEGSSWEVSHAGVIRGHILVAMGRGDEGEAELERAHGLFRRAGTGFMGHYQTGLAERELWAGRWQTTWDRARRGYDDLRASADLRWLGELTVLAARAVREGTELPGRHALSTADAESLVADYATVGREAQASGTIFGLEFQANLRTAEAELADARGDADPDRWRQVVEHWETARQPYPAAHARLRLAEARVRRDGSRTGAAAAAAEGLGAARAIGAEPLATAIEALARRARLDLAAAAVSRGASGRSGASDAATAADASRAEAGAAGLGLTRRERDVLALLADGRSDQEIADALFISPKTASVHVSNVKAKLGVERRVEAALIAARVLAGGR